MRILVVLSAIVVAVSALVIFYGGGKVAAATLTVNSTADTDDGACDPLATGECTLREAVNLLADGDTIAFAIPGADPGCNGAGVCTILSGDRFDIQSADATVDGYTQPGASPNTLFVGNDAALKIQITSSAPDAVRLQAPRITVQSLVINGSGNGIVLNAGGTDALIRGNFIGTDVTGTADASAGGIGVTGALGGAVIGETIPQSRNVISGLTIGIRLLGNFGNTVQNNYIGTDASGKLALANDEQGIWISASDDNMIGGKTASARNVISGNGGQAVLIGRDLSGGGGAAITASRATTSAPTQPVLNRSPTAPRRLGLMLSISKAVRRITSSAALPGRRKPHLREP